jgi:hypothetical protein
MNLKGKQTRKLIKEDSVLYLPPSAAILQEEDDKEKEREKYISVYLFNDSVLFAVNGGALLLNKMKVLISLFLSMIAIELFHDSLYF